MTDKYFNNTSGMKNRMEFLTPQGPCWARRENIASLTWFVHIAIPPDMDDTHAKIKTEAYVIVSETTNPIELYTAWAAVCLHGGNDDACAPNRGTNPIHHPSHYNSHASGVEAITLCRHMNFNLGNVIKYVIRAPHKGGVEDLKKAAWYIADEIRRLEK